MVELGVPHLVRETRLRLGLTQEQLAGRIKVTRGTVHRWENGHSEPSPMAIDRLQSEVKGLGDRGRDLLEQYFEEV